MSQKEQEAKRLMKQNNHLRKIMAGEIEYDPEEYKFERGYFRDVGLLDMQDDIKAITTLNGKIAKKPINAFKTTKNHRIPSIPICQVCNNEQFTCTCLLSNTQEVQSSLAFLHPAKATESKEGESSEYSEDTFSCFPTLYKFERASPRCSEALQSLNDNQNEVIYQQ